MRPGDGHRSALIGFHVHDAAAVLRELAGRSGTWVRRIDATAKRCNCFRSVTRGAFVLRAPAHTAELDHLIAAFPGVVVVQIHRDIVPTLASGKSLFAVYRATYSDDVDPWRSAGNRSIRARCGSGGPPRCARRPRRSMFVDVDYDDRWRTRRMWWAGCTTPRDSRRRRRSRRSSRPITPRIPATPTECIATNRPISGSNRARSTKRFAFLHGLHRDVGQRKPLAWNVFGRPGRRAAGAPAAGVPQIVGRDSGAALSVRAVCRAANIGPRHFYESFPTPTRSCWLPTIRPFAPCSTRYRRRCRRIREWSREPVGAWLRVTFEERPPSTSRASTGRRPPHLPRGTGNDVLRTHARPSRCRPSPEPSGHWSSMATTAARPAVRRQLEATVISAVGGGLRRVARRRFPEFRGTPWLRTCTDTTLAIRPSLDTRQRMGNTRFP